MSSRSRHFWIALFGGCISLSAAGAPIKQAKPKDPLEPARAALRTLQFSRAIELLSTAERTGNADAQYLLALIYLNGVGVAADPRHGRALLESAAAGGHGAAAYVLAGELTRDPGAPVGAARQWLERSAQLGYFRAAEALRSGRALLERESVGAADPTLFTPWVIECVRQNNAAELRRLGTRVVAVRDEFGRGPLGYAAAADSIEAATTLLEMGATLSAADAAGITPLMIAAERPDSAMLELLLGRAADPQAADLQQRTALFYAARSDRPAAIIALQRAGALLDVRDQHGYSALDAAVAVGADSAAAALRSLGVRANLMEGSPRQQSSRFDSAHPGEIYRGWPPLALAVSRNDITAVQQLLSSGADVNLRLPQGDSLLQVGADTHAFESLRLLLSRGADNSAVDHAGHSMLWRAATRSDIALVKVLLDTGVKPDAHANNEQTPFVAALGTGHPEAALILLAAGADPERTDAQGHTPLMLACASGDMPLVRALLERHVRSDAVDHEGRTALWYAAAAGSRGEVLALLAAGAAAGGEDARGLSPLHAAAAQKDAAVLEPLLMADAHPNRRSAEGDTALLIAAARGHSEVVQALLARTPELNVQNNAGDTALIAASRGGYGGICRLLLAAGANRALRNGAGVSAADVAVGRGFTLIAKDLGKG
jgi:uncharacterized protein